MNWMREKNLKQKKIFIEFVKYTQCFWLNSNSFFFFRFSLHKEFCFRDLFHFNNWENDTGWCTLSCVNSVLCNYLFFEKRKKKKVRKIFIAGNWTKKKSKKRSEIIITLSPRLTSKFPLFGFGSYLGSLLLETLFFLK